MLSPTTHNGGGGARLLVYMHARLLRRSRVLGAFPTHSAVCGLVKLRGAVLLLGDVSI